MSEIVLGQFVSKLKGKHRACARCHSTTKFKRKK